MGRARSIAKRVVLLVVLGLPLVCVPAAGAQETRSSPIQHGAKPNPGEVRPPSPDGNAPSLSAGTLQLDTKPNTVWGISAEYVVGVVAIAIAAVVVAALMAYARRPQIQRHRKLR